MGGIEFNLTKQFASLNEIFGRTADPSLVAYVGAEDLVSYQEEFHTRQSIIPFSYYTDAGRWRDKSGKTLEQIVDPNEVGADRLSRVLAVERKMRSDASIQTAAVFSEDLGYGRSYLYLYNRGKNGTIDAFAIEYQGTETEARDLLGLLGKKAKEKNHDAPRFLQPLFFSNELKFTEILTNIKTSLTPSQDKKLTEDYLRRLTRDTALLPLLVEQHHRKIYKLAERFREQMLQDDDTVRGLSAIVSAMREIAHEPGLYLASRSSSGYEVKERQDITIANLDAATYHRRKNHRLLATVNYSTKAAFDHLNKRREVVRDSETVKPNPSTSSNFSIDRHKPLIKVIKNSPVSASIAPVLAETVQIRKKKSEDDKPRVAYKKDIKTLSLDSTPNHRNKTVLNQTRQKIDKPKQTAKDTRRKLERIFQRVGNYLSRRVEITLSKTELPVGEKISSHSSMSREVFILRRKVLARVRLIKEIPVKFIHNLNKLLTVRPSKLSLEHIVKPSLSKVERVKHTFRKIVKDTKEKARLALSTLREKKSVILKKLKARFIQLFKERLIFKTQIRVEVSKKIFKLLKTSQIEKFVFTLKKVKIKSKQFFKELIKKHRKIRFPVKQNILKSHVRSIHFYELKHIFTKQLVTVFTAFSRRQGLKLPLKPSVLSREQSEVKTHLLTPQFYIWYLFLLWLTSSYYFKIERPQGVAFGQPGSNKHKKKSKSATIYHYLRNKSSGSVVVGWWEAMI